MVFRLLLVFLLPALLFGERTQPDAHLRGQSFGLENFLFQTYEDRPVPVKPKRVRVGIPRSTTTTTTERGPTYGMDTIQQYEPARLKPGRRPPEEIPEPTRIKENYVLKKEEEPETVSPETVTERIRKRIMMRRRRKRPSNAIQSDGNSEIIGNAILKPVRIPVYPQIPKVVVRTKVPDEDDYQRVKTIATPPTEEIPVTTTTTTTTTTTEPPTTQKPSTINLKTFLKQQTETLSLSELLQTQNLSLADLLRGNKDASAILKARQTISSTTTVPSVRRKQFGTTSTEPVKKTDILEATTSRPNYNRFLPKIPRIKPVDRTPEEETFEEKPKKPGPDPQNRLTELRSKLKNFQRKTQPPTALPEMTSPTPTRDETIEPASPSPTTTEVPLHKKNRVSFKSANNPEISLIIPTKPKPEPEKRPERLSTWTNRLPSVKRFGQDKPKQEDVPVKPLKVPTVEESSEEVEDPKTTLKPVEELPPEDTRKPQPKDELIELLKSGQNADKLQRILYSRNMTIQELLDNREKPTLQTDISQLFTSPQKEETTRPTLFDSLPDFDLEGSDPLEGKDPVEYDDEPEAEESAPREARVELIPAREPKQFEFPEKSDLNLQPDDLTADTSNAENSALWKLSEKSIYYGNSYGYGNYPTTQTSENPKKIIKTELTDSDIILLETLRRSQETNRKFKLDIKDFIHQEEEEPKTEDIEKSYIPPAVKSAIIASGVVMGIALFVFIAIFATCGWKQRQIRLKGSSSILGGTLTKTSDKSKRTNTLSPVSFKDNHSYKKTIDFDEESSESGTSNASSYLWNTLKNTFTSRTNTLKSLTKEKMREDKTTLRRNESRRKSDNVDDRPTTYHTQDERYTLKKIDRERNVINTSFNFKRSASNNNVSHFNDCVHGY